MKQIKLKKVSVGVTLAVAVLLLAIGIALLVLDPQISVTIAIFAEIALIVLNGIQEVTIAINEGKKKEAVVRTIVYLAIIAFILIFSMIFLTALNILYAIVALILFIIRVMICVHLAKNGGKHIVRNAIAGLICLAFGIILLVLPPKSKVVFVVMVVGIFFILYSFNYFIDFFAAVLKTDMKEDRKFRRKHFSLPNLFTAGLVSDVIKECEKLIKENPEDNTFVMSSKEYDPDKINFEVFVHVNKEGKSMGHIDVCVEGTVFSYGDYDERSKILGGLFGGGTFFSAPKKKYINNCIRTANKYILGYGCELSEKQLVAVKERIREMIGVSKELTLEEAIKDNRTDDDYLVVLLRMGGQVYLVEQGEFRRYFGLATNCVALANTIMGRAGFEDLSQGSLKTPGAYFDMLEGMLYRQNTRIVQKTYFVKVDDE